MFLCKCVLIFNCSKKVFAVQFRCTMASYSQQQPILRTAWVSQKICGLVEHLSILCIQKIGKICLFEWKFVHGNAHQKQTIYSPTFASQITSGYIDHIPLKEDYLRQINFEKTPLYVLLRCYRGFDTCGFAVKNKPVLYKPFKLIFRKAPEMPSTSVSAQNENSALRIICAIALSSIYKGLYLNCIWYVFDCIAYMHWYELCDSISSLQ